MAKYVPSPRDWVREQVELYESSGGTKGTTLRDTGLPVIIVTHTGNKTGAIRKTPLMRVKDGNSYVLVGSQGGAPEDPVWVHNLRADPNIEFATKPSCARCGSARSRMPRNAPGCGASPWRPIRLMPTTRRGRHVKSRSSSRRHNRRIEDRRTRRQNSTSSSSSSSGSALAAATHSAMAGQRHDGAAVGGALASSLHVVGAGNACTPARTWRRPCVGCAEQVGPAVGREALAPDGHDAVDVGLRAGPDLEARMVGLEVHRQRRAQIGEARMHLAADRAAMGAGGAIGRQQAGLGVDLVPGIRRSPACPRP